MALELVLLSLASAFWPLLLVVVLAALHTDEPRRILLAFLITGLATCTVIGVLVVKAFQHGRAIGDSGSSFSAGVYLGAAVGAFLIAAIVRHLPKGEPKPKEEKSGGWTGKIEQNGVKAALVCGVLFNLLPGVFPIVALKDIAQLDVTLAEAAAIIFFFYLGMFVLVEVPLFWLYVAPEKARSRTERFNAWLGANKMKVAEWALEVIGVYLVVRGIVLLV
ncbi:MAG TPA: GAP family protein [Gaiellaceae bacterium]|nr:GAP family protein [Gaiellaceae bacterium]